MNCIIFFSAVLAAVTKYGVYSYPDGAPMEACSTLTPQHGAEPTPCDGCLFTLRLTEIDSSPVDEAMAHLYQCGRRHTSKLYQNLYVRVFSLKGMDGIIDSIDK